VKAKNTAYSIQQTTGKKKKKEANQVVLMYNECDTRR
jgi:hypothetical protein